MTTITITVDDEERTITNIDVQLIDLAYVEGRLAEIYNDFDPNHPERLLEREEEVTRLYNRRLDLKAIIAKWDDAERASANILEAWAVVEEIRKGNAS